ncbi:hypothetical protein AGMMS50239_35280 [Bacteroidia bacterium]|nr:hypothetical protein AGMMS50239_35280 [Bacteroidia bacterium]
MSEEKTSTNNIYIDTNVLIGSFIGKPADVNCLKVLYSMKWKNFITNNIKDFKGYLNIQAYKPSNVFVLRKK